MWIGLSQLMPIKLWVNTELNCVYKGAGLFGSKVTSSHPSLSTALLITLKAALSQVHLFSLLQGKPVWPTASSCSLLPYYQAGENSSKYEQKMWVIEGLLNLKLKSLFLGKH